jgi:hypothetical protein
MKITVKQLKQLIRENVQEQMQQEGIDEIFGLFGGKKSATDTKKTEQKPVDQKVANYFKIPGGYINFDDKFLKWAEKEWGLYGPRDGKFFTGNPENVKKNVEHFRKEIKNSSGLQMDSTMNSVIKTIAGWKPGMPEPTDADLEGVENMLYFIQMMKIEPGIKESLRRVVREEIKRQLRIKR